MANNDGSDEDEYWQNYRYSAAFRRASFHPPDEVWTLFSEAEDCCEIIDYFKALIKVTNIDPNLKGIKFYEVLKSKLTSWKCQSLWDLLNARLKHKEYQNGSVCKDLNCAIIGAGPIGLRTAIEFLLLGCRRVSIIEKRNEFSRNNVLHLWPFLLTDFKALGAKKFYGKFGAGCIDHINIRTLQCILLKVVLVLGGDVHIGVTFKRMLEPKDTTAGWTIQLDPENLSISKIPFDVVVGADGKKNVLPGFPQIELRGALAIGITCNFVNNNTIEEARVPEISGVSYQFNPTFFNDMQAQYGVKLENIVYYKNETHYFVMTALKSSLLQLGVLREEQSDPRRLLHSSNVDRKKLIDFTLSAVNFATNHQLPKLDFKTLSNGEPDIALFDFTSIKKAANASRIIERKGHKLLLALVGDSLIEPFWPTGSGCGRGVLSSLDVAWMVRQFGLKHPPLSILRERENVFKLLSGTNNDSLQKNYKAFTIDPKTRYSSFDTKRVSNMTSLKGLYDTDDPDHADFTVVSPMPSTEPTPVKKTAAQRRRSSSGSSRKVTSTHLHPHLSSTLSSSKKKRSAEKKEQQSVGSTKAFWEEHNKKNFTEKAKEHVPKKKSNISTNSIEEGVEALSDLDDDVIVDQITDNNNFKRGPVKMSNKSEKKSENKVKYQAKGGGLRARREASKKTPEKPTTTETKQRRRSVGSKKNLRKKTKSESENNQTQKTDPPSKKDDNKNRYSNINVSNNAIKNKSRQVLRKKSKQKNLPKHDEDPVQPYDLRIRRKRSGYKSCSDLANIEEEAEPNTKKQRISRNKSDSDLKFTSLEKRPLISKKAHQSQRLKSSSPMITKKSLSKRSIQRSTKISRLSVSPISKASHKYRRHAREKRLCPLGTRNKNHIPGLVTAHKLLPKVVVTNSHTIIMQEENSEIFSNEQNDQNNQRKRRLHSDFRNVRLESVKNKRRSMLPSPKSFVGTIKVDS